MAKQMGFYFDSSACNACRACVVACKSKNNLPVDINWRRVYEYGGGGWVPDGNDRSFLVPSNIFAYALSVACMHCQNPICVSACPAGSMLKRDEDGLVVIDIDNCIGCRYCEWACPYGAPQFDEERGVMTKCDGCVDLVERGETPYCAAACVMRALEFGDIEELRAKYGDVAAIEPLPAADVTNPSVVITPHRHAQFSGQGTGRIFNLEEV
jgi:anaerobic dimethyl sulfoxide reductase subunit B (iron-sulfur subunit)